MLLVGRPQRGTGEPGRCRASLAHHAHRSVDHRDPRDGRTVHLIGLGGAHTAPLLARIAAQMNDAGRAVTAFWGPELAA